MSVDFFYASLPRQAYIDLTVSRIALVRPQRARAIQELLIRMAQGGQLRGKVSESMLIGLLDQVEAAEARGQGGGSAGGRAGGGSGKITVRRGASFPSNLVDSRLCRSSRGKMLLMTTTSIFDRVLAMPSNATKDCTKV